ncbi:hypothetical protein BDZ91DRAFT_853677 [Kalaharituber pfeilii]|nr:hypothetical protein BDZ91DRAFT_853677 [Kalaharituber pfeilii]
MSLKRAHTPRDIYRSARRSAANCNGVRVSCTCTSTGESRKLPTQEEAFRRHQAHKTPPQTASPATEDATTRGGVGIVIHGIALRKDLGKVKKWLAAANESLGKIKGIRWLRKRNLLEEAGKTTSSVVVYLQKEVDVEKVRLSGRWHRSARHESERRRR